MVISTYRRIGEKKKDGYDAIWYSGETQGVDVAKIKITNGPWLRIEEENGEFKITHPTEDQHGQGSGLGLPKLKMTFEELQKAYC